MGYRFIDAIRPNTPHKKEASFALMPHSGLIGHFSILVYAQTRA
jgi:hypothetical protein